MCCGDDMNQSTFQNLNQAHLLFIELSKAINEVLDEQDINISRNKWVCLNYSMNMVL